MQDLEKSNRFTFKILEMQTSEEHPTKIDNDEEYDDEASVDESDPELPEEETSPVAHNHTRCFKQEYHCFPLSHINKTHLEDGNKILMPASALRRLMSMNIEYPMVFEIRNPCSDRVSHCGVLEFSAEEGYVFLPDWMMKNLQLQYGNLVTLRSTTLPKGTFMKIQPHTMKFLAISDPKSALEAALRDFSCLTIGDTIMLTHDHKKYDIDIVETKPSGAISVIETDLEVDFATPLDYKEPEKKPKSMVNPKREPEKATEDMGKEEPKFRPFTGVARRLDGQPLIAPVESDSVSTSLVKDGLVAADSIRSRKRKHPGKLVFGPKDVSQSQEKSARVSKEDHEERTSKNDKQKFQPFTGMKHTLAG